MKIEKDNIREIRENGIKLQKLLGLDYPAVGVKLIESKEEVPDGYRELEEPVRHCEMIQIARKEGKKFYATKEKQSCKGGAYALGILQEQEVPEPLKTGKLYYDLGNFETEEAGRKTVTSILRVKDAMYGAVYAALNNTDFEADSIVVICTPKKGMILTQATLYKEGGVFQTKFSGFQSVCADAVAAVKVNGIAKATLGCYGSREYAKINDYEMIFAFPSKDLANINAALERSKEVWG